MTHEPLRTCCIDPFIRRGVGPRRPERAKLRARHAAGGQGQYGPDGKEQAREVLRHQRRRKERLRRGRALLRRPIYAGTRPEVLRPVACWRLRQDRRWQEDGDLMAHRRSSTPPTAMGTQRSTIPAKAGIGLRFQHHHAVVEGRPDVAWFEVHAENYFGGGTRLRYLDAVARGYPLSLHGTGLSLGSAEGLDDVHLERLRQLIERVDPGLVSEHLSWSAVDGIYL